MNQTRVLLHSRPLPDEVPRKEGGLATLLSAVPTRSSTRAVKARTRGANRGRSTFYRRTLRKVGLRLGAFVAVSTLALIIVSTVFGDEIKASFGAPADCICVAMHPQEAAAQKPSPAGNLRM